MIAQSYVPRPVPDMTGPFYEYQKNLRFFLGEEFQQLGRSLASGDAVQWANIVVPWNQFYLVSDKPDPDTTNGGVLFPQNSASEVAQFAVMLPFNWYGAEGKSTTLNPRVHFIETSSSKPTFRLQYRLIREGGAPPSFVTLTASSFAVTYSSGTILQTGVFPAITVAAPVGLVHSMDCKLYRDDNTVSGDVLTKGASFVIEVNSLGARRIGEK